MVFDLGHTLWDIGPHDEALERAYEDLRATLEERLGHDGLPEAAALQAAVRDALFAAAPTYFGEPGNLDQPPTWTWVDEGCRAIGLELDRELVRELTPPLFATEVDALICHDGTCEAIADLHADGYRIGCITNTLADTATIRQMLRNYDVERLMDSVVVSADEGWRKPHRSLFQKSLRELDVHAEETVFVGDSPVHDVAGAKAVGMRAVLTRQYRARPYEGVDPQPDAIIDHLRELRDVIHRLDASA